MRSILSGSYRTGAGILTMVLLVTACGGGDAPSDADSADPRVVASDPANSTRDSLTPDDLGDLDRSEIGLTLDWTRNQISRPHDEARGPAALVGVETERGPGFDRVIFTFADRIPGYSLSYVTEGGAGCDGMEEPGKASAARLLINLELASANTDGRPNVSDRNRGLSFPSLDVATQTCDVDFKVSWLMGLTSTSDFRVMEMRGEPRLVVDISHPAP